GSWKLTAVLLSDPEFLNKPFNLSLCVWLNLDSLSLVVIALLGASLAHAIRTPQSLTTIYLGLLTFPPSLTTISPTSHTYNLTLLLSTILDFSCESRRTILSFTCMQ
ncbi:hypothetical protein ILYODFUR_011556, partial [Ilyodon furcidens]